MSGQHLQISAREPNIKFNKCKAMQLERKNSLPKYDLNGIELAGKISLCTDRGGMQIGSSACDANRESMTCSHRGLYFVKMLLGFAFKGKIFSHV